MKPETNTFIEEIIYCPSQIYYYFELNETEKYCLYLRQRRDPQVTARLIKCDDDWEFIWENPEPEIINLPRNFDINNQNSLEDEEKEIEELEKTCMELLKTKFPDIQFPENPVRTIDKIKLYLDDINDI